MSDPLRSGGNATQPAESRVREVVAVVAAASPSRLWSLLRKCLVIAVGFPLLLFGLIMIPLPGPGLLICVGGLFVLSLEFEWAKRHLASTRARLDKVMTKVSDRGSRAWKWWKRRAD